VVRQMQQPKYDRAITTFSADGRLQQVEYGMEAANRGESVVAAKINQTLALVVVPATTAGGNKIHRIDAHILMATAGLAGDGRALASALRSSCQRHLLSYGERPTVQEAAQMAAQIQHDLTKTAGARPLGCTAIVVGVDESGNDDDVPGEVQIYHTDPGGVLEHCNYCVAGKNKNRILTGISATYDEDDDSSSSVSLAMKVTIKTLKLLKESDDKADKCNLWLVRAIDSNEEGRMGLTCSRSVDEEQLASSTATRLSLMLQ
jgi:20S proteasome alpha/beta subunit